MRGHVGKACEMVLLSNTLRAYDGHVVYTWGGSSSTLWEELSAELNLPEDWDEYQNLGEDSPVPITTDR